MKMHGEIANKQVTRRSLAMGAVSMVLCVVMLVATTFAWFTDTVSSKGNTIKSGKLEISAVAYGVNDETGEALTFSGLDGLNEGKEIVFSKASDDIIKLTADGALKAIINAENWEPGKTGATLIEIANIGTLAAKIEIGFNVSKDIVTNKLSTTEPLSNGLWYALIPVVINNSIITLKDTAYTLAKARMSGLKDSAIPIELLEADASECYILAYGMDILMDNIFQNGEFVADINVLATQATYEEDGFGNDQYDADAEFATIVPLRYGSGKLESNGIVANMGWIGFRTTEDLSLAGYYTDKGFINGDVIQIAHELSTDGGQTWVRYTHQARRTNYSSQMLNFADPYDFAGPVLGKVIDVIPAGSYIATNESSTTNRYPEICNAIAASTTANPAYVRAVVLLYKDASATGVPSTDLLYEVITFPHVTYTDAGRTVVPLGMGTGIIE